VELIPHDPVGLGEASACKAGDELTIILQRPLPTTNTSNDNITTTTHHSQQPRFELPLQVTPVSSTCPPANPNLPPPPP
jgi:hypothetical protein